MCNSVSMKKYVQVYVDGLQGPFQHNLLYDSMRTKEMTQYCTNNIYSKRLKKSPPFNFSHEKSKGRRGCTTVLRKCPSKMRRIICYLMTGECGMKENSLIFHQMNLESALSSCGGV